MALIWLRCHYVDDADDDGTQSKVKACEASPPPVWQHLNNMVIRIYLIYVQRWRSCSSIASREKKEVFSKQKKRSKLLRNYGCEKKSDTHAKYSVDSQHEPLDENRMQKKRTLLNVHAVRRHFKDQCSKNRENLLSTFVSEALHRQRLDNPFFFFVPFKSSFFRRFRLSRLKPLHTQI